MFSTDSKVCSTLVLSICSIFCWSFIAIYNIEPFSSNIHKTIISVLKCLREIQRQFTRRYIFPIYHETWPCYKLKNYLKAIAIHSIVFKFYEKYIYFLLALIKLISLNDDWNKYIGLIYIFRYFHHLFYRSRRL